MSCSQTRLFRVSKPVWKGVKNLTLTLSYFVFVNNSVQAADISLPTAHGLPVAQSAQRLVALADGLGLLSSVGTHGTDHSHPRTSARPHPFVGRAQTSTHCGHPRQSERQGQRDVRAVRLRCGQEDQRTGKLPAVRIGHGANFVERTAAVLAYNMAAKIVIERL
jgi:hypothetical protein